eukprot:ANDGO_03431.mRNA.1 Tuberous sclerosis 2 protein homolog
MDPETMIYALVRWSLLFPAELEPFCSRIVSDHRRSIDFGKVFSILKEEVSRVGTKKTPRRDTCLGTSWKLSISVLRCCCDLEKIGDPALLVGVMKTMAFVVENLMVAVAISDDDLAVLANALSLVLDQNVDPCALTLISLISSRSMCSAVRIFACSTSERLIQAVCSSVVKADASIQSVLRTCKSILEGPDGLNVHAAMRTLVSSSDTPFDVVRGAVLVLSWSSWGAHRLRTLDVPFSSTLHSFSLLCSYRQVPSVVADDVVHAIHRLIDGYHAALLDTEWGYMLSVLSSILSLFPAHRLSLHLLEFICRELHSFQRLYLGPMDALVRCVVDHGTSSMWTARLAWDALRIEFSSAWERKIMDAVLCRPGVERDAREVLIKRLEWTRLWERIGKIIENASCSGEVAEIVRMCLDPHAGMGRKSGSHASLETVEQISQAASRNASNGEVGFSEREMELIRLVAHSPFRSVILDRAWGRSDPELDEYLLPTPCRDSNCCGCKADEGWADLLKEARVASLRFLWRASRLVSKILDRHDVPCDVLSAMMAYVVSPRTRLDKQGETQDTLLRRLAEKMEHSSQVLKRFIGKTAESPKPKSFDFSAAISAALQEGAVADLMEVLESLAIAFVLLPADFLSTTFMTSCLLFLANITVAAAFLPGTLPQRCALVLSSIVDLPAFVLIPVVRELVDCLIPWLISDSGSVSDSGSQGERFIASRLLSRIAAKCGSEGTSRVMSFLRQSDRSREPILFEFAESLECRTELQMQLKRKRRDGSFAEHRASHHAPSLSDATFFKDGSPSSGAAVSWSELRDHVDDDHFLRVHRHTPLVTQYHAVAKAMPPVLLSIEVLRPATLFRVTLRRATGLRRVLIHIPRQSLPVASTSSSAVFGHDFPSRTGGSPNVSSPPSTSPNHTHHVAGSRSRSASETGGVLDVDTLSCILAATNLEVVVPLCVQVPFLISIEDQAFSRAVSVLDKTVPYDTLKCGLVLVSALYSPTDSPQSPMLSLAHRMASQNGRYERFLANLGTFRQLSSMLEKGEYTAGLTPEDGDHVLAYDDESRLTRLVFHVTSMMPTLEYHTNAGYNARTVPASYAPLNSSTSSSPLQHVNKRRHIGNDFVTVIYTEHSALFENFDPSTMLPGEFHYVYVLVHPIAATDMNRVRMVLVQRYGLPIVENGACPSSTWLVPDHCVAYVARFLVLVASVGIMGERRKGGYVVSNWEARSQQLSTIRDRFFSSQNVSVVALRTSRDASRVLPVEDRW